MNDYNTYKCNGSMVKDNIELKTTMNDCNTYKFRNTYDIFIEKKKGISMICTSSTDKLKNIQSELASPFVFKFTVLCTGRISLYIYTSA